MRKLSTDDSYRLRMGMLFQSGALLADLGVYRCVACRSCGLSGLAESVNRELALNGGVGS